MILHVKLFFIYSIYKPFYFFLLNSKKNIFILFNTDMDHITKRNLTFLSKKSETNDEPYLISGKYCIKGNTTFERKDNYDGKMGKVEWEETDLSKENLSKEILSDLI